MHWRNPPKEVRRTDWHTAPPPCHDCVKEAHKWCTDSSSEGRFYHHYTNTRWWFEQEADAIMFALRYSGRRKK